MTRPFVAEITILQRERNRIRRWCCGPSAAWWCSVCTLIMIEYLTWGAGRINGENPPTRRRSSSHRHRHKMSLDVWIHAGHSLLLAIPAFVPAFVVAGVVAYVAMKDTAKQRRASQ